MTNEKISEFVAMLNAGYSQRQVRETIFKHCLTNGAGNLTLDATIDRAMELYAEVLKRANA